jgi:uncharacterized damage-inducible protein DinB
MQLEPWLNGPIDGIPPLLMPVAHALLQCRNDIRDWCSAVPDSDLWTAQVLVAPLGFQLRHIAGSIDRLLAYARGEALSDQQMSDLRAEHTSGNDAEFWVSQCEARIDSVLEHLKTVAESTLLEPRFVGRRQLPTNVIGLLFHLAEHTQRHVGQMIVTARILGVRPEKADAQ